MPSVSTSRFKFKVPYTNPVYFDKLTDDGVEYRVWHDSLINEQYRHYTQRWSLSDRLSLQFSWENIPAANNLSIVVRFYVNGVLSGSVTKHIGSSLLQGDMYTDFIVQRMNESGTSLNGCYCFSQIIGYIRHDNGLLSLQDGDCLEIEVGDPTGATWMSNRMKVTDRLNGTKLIHYSNISALMQNEYDTYFGYMPFGYDLRIEADFHEQTPGNSVSVFQDYNGGYELVSALPFETVKLTIGDDGVQIPRYLQRTLNAVMSCSEKSIDGEDFEITGEPLSVDRIDGYANDVYSVVIALSKNRFSYQSEGEHAFSAYAEEYMEQQNKVQTGSISIFTTEDWYVNPASIEDSDIVLDKVSGGAGTTKIDYELPKNTTQDEVKTIEFVSVLTNEVIGTASVVSRRTFAGGIGYMRVGDTMAVSKGNKKQ